MLNFGLCWKVIKKVVKAILVRRNQPVLPCFHIFKESMRDTGASPDSADFRTVCPMPVYSV